MGELMGGGCEDGGGVREEEAEDLVAEFGGEGEEGEGHLFVVYKLVVVGVCGLVVEGQLVVGAVS